ncbi:MAG: peptide ABC transporter ATP-binding protein, partial [Candidatus Infernicultor aquiphilus]
GKTVGGEVIFKGENLLKKTEDEMRGIRGKEIAIIFQEPMTALNPVLTVGFQISEALMMHFKIGKKEAINKSVELLKKVEIPMPEERANEYPHQLSGGMRQ